MDNINTHPVGACQDGNGMSRLSHLHKQMEVMLVEAASEGNLDAFNELVLQYQDVLYRHAYFISGDPDLAADIVQESFIRAFRGLGTFRCGSFRAWMLKIVTNIAFDLRRRSRKHVTLPLFPEDDEGKPSESPFWLADPAASVQALVERKEDAERLCRALEELPASYRTVITLIDLLDLDYQEAAQALQIPVGTIKSRLARARMQMREKLISPEENIVSHGSSGLPVVC